MSGFMQGGGGIMKSAMEMIKEKERQAERASQRLHDGLKTQMEMTASQGSWTGDGGGQRRPTAAVKEVVKEEPAKEESATEESTDKPKAPGAPGALGNEVPDVVDSSEGHDEESDDDVSKMGIMELAAAASK